MVVFFFEVLAFLRTLQQLLSLASPSLPLRKMELPLKITPLGQVCFWSQFLGAHKQGEREEVGNQITFGWHLGEKK